MEGMAFQKPFNSQKTPFDRTEPLNRFQGVLRASGCEAAGRRF